MPSPVTTPPLGICRLRYQEQALDSPDASSRVLDTSALAGRAREEGWGRGAWNGVRLSCLFRSPAQEGGGSVWLLGAPQPHPCPVWRREGSVYWVIHTRFLSHRAQCSFPSESHTPVVSVRSFFPCLLPSMRHRVPQAPKAPLALPSSLLTVRGAASPHAPLNCDYQVSTLIT